MGRFSMIPLLNEIQDLNGLAIWKTTDGKIGTGFELVPCDLETENAEIYFGKILGLIRSLDPRILARIKVKSSQEKSFFENCSRKNPINQIGSVKNSFQLFVEVASEPLIIKMIRFRIADYSDDKDLEALFKVYEQIKQSGLKTKPLCFNHYHPHFPSSQSNWIKANTHVSDGNIKIGVVRLNKPTSEAINEFTLSEALLNIPKPFEVSVSFQKIDDRKMKLNLERRLKQSAANKDDPTAATLNLETIETIKNSIKSGLILPRKSGHAFMQRLIV